MKKTQIIQKIKNECEKIDKILFEAEKEFAEIEKIIEKLESFSKKMKVLENFYFNENWQEKRKILEQAKQDNFYCMSEDGIWNLSVANQQEKIKLIKQLVEEL